MITAKQFWLLVSIFILQLITIGKSFGDGPPRVDPYTMLPQPMLEVELEQFAELLQLSEAQQAFAKALYRDYLDEFAALTPRIIELNRRERDRRTTGVSARGERDDYVSRTIQQMHDEAKAIVRDSGIIEQEMKQLEDEFFHQLSSVLAESQVQEMYRAMQERKRVRYQVRTESLPGAQVDIVAIIRQMDVLNVDDDAISAILAVYLDRLVQLLELRHQAQKRVHVGDLAWLVEMDGASISKEALDRRGRIRARQIRLESSLRQLNISTLEALSTALDSQQAIMLFDTFYRTAHPMPAWWPDHSAGQTRAMLAEAFDRDDLDEGVSDEIAYLQELFNRNYRRLQRRLSDADFNFRERVDRTQSTHIDDIEAYEAEVRTVLVERKALSERILHSVKELLELQEFD
jgi:hypothetical protein